MDKAIYWGSMLPKNESKSLWIDQTGALDCMKIGCLLIHWHNAGTVQVLSATSTLDFT